MSRPALSQGKRAAVNSAWLLGKTMARNGSLAIAMAASYAFSSHGLGVCAAEG